MPSKAVVLIVASFLLVVLILSLYSIPKASARPATARSCSVDSMLHTITCCDTTTETTTKAVLSNVRTTCDDTNPPSNCTPPYNGLGKRPSPGNPSGLSPPIGPTLPSLGNHTGTVTNGPPRLGTVLPPSGNNTGSPGKTSIFNPIRNTTNALPGSNNTATLPPGSMFKVPPGTTSTPSNNTGTPPALTITKEHNPASPNVFSSVSNTTSQNNNTSTLKLSPLEQHHHKGSNIAGNNQTKSIQGHSHVTVRNNG